MMTWQDLSLAALTAAAPLFSAFAAGAAVVTAITARSAIALNRKTVRITQLRGRLERFEELLELLQLIPGEETTPSHKSKARFDGRSASLPEADYPGCARVRKQGAAPEALNEAKAELDAAIRDGQRELDRLDTP
jgi:hypothetical protein